MEKSSQEGVRRKRANKAQTFPIPFTFVGIKKNISISTNKENKLSKEQIINQAFKFYSQGNIQKAAKYYQQLITRGCTDFRIFANYAAVLKRLNKLKEAELSLRKAIELKPDYANGHSNLGNILKDLGKLKEAELYTRKAIKLEPNFANGHSNLGNILKDLGKLKEAELSLRKAIKLEPNFAVNHYNLGNILKDLGKLKDAELSTRRAIKLKPNFADAHSNLGDILSDLGKLEDLILLSKSTLESNSINGGYKLLALLRITISHLIKQDFSATLVNINKVNKLISQGVINDIKEEKNKKYLFNFSGFITSLYPLLYKENKNSTLDQIPHVGESHCLSFAHQTLSICSQQKKIQPVFIIGGKAWHFAKKENNKWKDSLKQQIKNHIYSDQVFISFGEIDCRKDEGILIYIIKSNKNISEVCKNTVNSYVNHIEVTLSPYYSKRYYFGVPAPTRTQESIDDLDIKRVEIIKVYNLLLKKEVLSRGSYFLDVYELTSNKNGENNNIHMCDNHHLSPKCLSLLFERHLYKP